MKLNERARHNAIECWLVQADGYTIAAGSDNVIFALIRAYTDGPRK